MKTAWAHLPNARHIDRILAAAKTDPLLWVFQYTVNPVPDETLRTISELAWEAIVGTEKVYTWYAAYDIIVRTIDYRVSHKIKYVIEYLIAHDDCAYMLDSEVDQIKILAVLGDPKAILLLPVCNVFHLTKELV